MTLLSLAQFLIAFGVIFGLAGWYLYQKSLAKLIEHLKVNQRTTWEALGSPATNIDPVTSLQSDHLRNYITQQQYQSSEDVFVRKLGNVIRQKLLFCLFCLVCFLLGLILLLCIKWLG